MAYNLMVATTLNRATLRKLSKARLRDAQILLRNRRWGGAYYLAGYSIECSLKAAIARSTKKTDFPDKYRVDASYTHDLNKLVKVAGLSSKIEGEPNVTFQSYWLTSKDWNEISRYNEHTEQEARDLIKAITDPTFGVLQWIEKT